MSGPIFADTIDVANDKIAAPTDTPAIVCQSAVKASNTDSAAVSARKVCASVYRAISLVSVQNFFVNIVSPNYRMNSIIFYAIVQDLLFLLLVLLGFFENQGSVGEVLHLHRLPRQYRLQQ